MSDEQHDDTVATAAGATAPGPRSIAPAFARYNDETLLGGVWKRPGLSPRDRSLVTAAALVARGQTVEMPFYFELALDSGVRPAELSELVTQLACLRGLAERVLGAAGREERPRAAALRRWPDNRENPT